MDVPRSLTMRFGLRVVLLVVFFLCVGFAWVSWEIKSANERGRLVAEIKRGGGTVYFDYQQKIPETERQLPVFSEIEPPSSWQRRVLGDPFVDTVVCVDFGTGRDTDADLARLSAFGDLEYLLINGSDVTDAGLRHLTCLTKLRGLVLTDAQITDEGLRHLAALRNLFMLGINNCESVSDDGISELQSKLPNCWISR